MAIDPYRTLGLTTAASLDEVKRAYRRLAKRYHPDAAGDDATLRFLAVQAAYEAIVGGSAGPGARPGTSAPGSARPWQADPARARATRDAYRARGGAWRARGQAGQTAGGTRQGPSDAGTRAGTRAERESPAGDPRAGSGAAGSGGSGAGQTGPAASGGRSGKRSSARRKATLTSTSYDEAAREPFEPDWDGGSWYGTSSGTYWTINPKEYADPRKHGPEYQARARRAAAHPGGDTGDPPAAGWTGPAATWTAPTATWAGTADDPAGATSPDGAAASAGGADMGAGAPPPADPWRAPDDMSDARGGGPSRDEHVPREAGHSPLSAGLAAGVVTAIPSGIVLVVTSAAGASAATAVALLAPMAVAVAVATMTARRGRARTPR